VNKINGKLLMKSLFSVFYKIYFGTYIVSRKTAGNLIQIYYQKLIESLILIRRIYTLYAYCNDRTNLIA